MVLGVVTGKASMKTLADFLTGRPLLRTRVSDGTHVEGIYDIDITVAVPLFINGAPRGQSNGQAESFDALQDALRHQLGLQLNEAKVQTRLIVIDRVEKP